jgi:tight adherence protein B
MTQQLLLLVLGATAFLGTALFWAIRADRRRQTVQQRLQAAAAVGRSADDEPVVQVSLLRRTLAQTRPGMFPQTLAELWGRLDGAFAATGNRIGLPHLGAAAGIAAAIVFGFCGGVMGFGPGVTIVLATAAAAAAPIVLLRVAQSRFQNRFLEVFPDALDLIMRAVRAGLPVSEAMAVAAREIGDPVGGELRQTLEQVRIGVEMGDALQEMADRVRVPDFRFLVVALALQQKTGGALAETLANLSGVIRARRMLRLRARALSSEAKASAAVLGVLPFVAGAFMLLFNHPLASLLFVDPRGRFMMGVAFLMLVTGLGVMAVIVRRSLR